MKTLSAAPAFLERVLQKQYIDVIARNETSIGVEIELPLVPMEGGFIDHAFSAALTAHLREMDFKETAHTLDGDVCAMENKDGDVCSFETTWNTLEFSMKRSSSLSALACRFYPLLFRVQEFCLTHGYYLCGRGINPNAARLCPEPLRTPVLLAKSQFLTQFTEHHDGEIFHAICASTQTHLDAKNQMQYMRLFRLLRRVYAVEGLFFANSPPPAVPELFLHHPALAGLERSTLCFRDELWRHCGAPNVQTGTKELEDTAELCLYLAEMKLFILREGETFRPIAPVPLRQHFAEGCSEMDLEAFRSLEPVAPTKKGSLEVRSTCTQPLDRLMEPVAFYLGLSANQARAEKVLDKLYQTYFAKDSPAAVRDKLMQSSAVALRQSLRDEMTALLDAALEGLAFRGLKEEQFLLPLKCRFGKADFEPPAAAQGQKPFAEVKAQMDQIKRCRYED